MIRTATVMAALALALASCGDRDDPSTVDTTTSTTAAQRADVDYTRPGEPTSLGEGLVEAAAPDGSAFYVLDEDPTFQEPGCEGQPEPVLFSVPIDGGDRVRLGTSTEALRGRVVQGPGDRVAVVEVCEDFLQQVRVGTETAGGRIERLRTVPLDPDSSVLQTPRVTAWDARGDALLAGGVSPDRQEGVAARIDPASGAITGLFETGPGGGPTQVAQLADGTYVVAGDGQVSLRSASGEVTGRTPGNGFELFADGRKVLVFGQALSVLAPGSPATTLVGGQPGRFFDRAVPSPDGQAVAYAATSGEVTEIAVVKLAGGDPSVVGEPGTLGRPVFSGDGRAVGYSRFEREAPFATEVLVARFADG